MLCVAIWLAEVADFVGEPDELASNSRLEAVSGMMTKLSLHAGNAVVDVVTLLASDKVAFRQH